MVTITTRGFKCRDEIKNKVNTELQRIIKMMPENTEYQVTITLKHEEFTCDVTVKHIGTFIRGEAKSEDVLSAIDFAVDDLKRKLRKFKTKIQERYDLTAYNEALAEMDDDDDENNEFNISRIKKITPIMMNDEEAILQMEMLGHTFFVYTDENGNTSIIYKRKETDTSYGKIICS